MTRRFSPDRLRKARGKRTRDEIAAACKRSAVTVWNWEAGKSRPDTDDLAAISALTGKPLEFFYEQVA